MTFREADIMQVAALGSDPSTVVVSNGSDEGITVPCLVSYNPRMVGDRVLVVRLPGGGWLCVDAVGATRSPVSYGVGVPTDGGWRRSTTAYVRDNADGTRSIYLDTAGSVPMPVIVQAVSAGGFLSNTTTTSVLPRAGASLATTGDWFGAWYYSGGIASAAAAGAVSTMTVRITRNQEGRTASVPIVLGLHSSADDVRPTITDQWDTGVSLAPGGSASIAVPPSQRSKLAAGSALGVAVLGAGVSSFATFTSAAPVTITFG